MRLLSFFVILALGACNTPTPEFYGVDPVNVTVDGSDYKVYFAGDRAQTVRTNSEMEPNADAEEKITQSIEIASGCDVVGDLRGDVVLANARLDCGKGARPWPTEIELIIECETVGKHARRVYCNAY